MSTLTVQEAVNFHAQMRLPREMPMEEKLRRAKDVVQRLGLAALSNNIVGDPDQGGLSPELRKKLSIAV